MSDPIMQKLNEMQARCDAATEGPWEAERGGESHCGDGCCSEWWDNRIWAGGLVLAESYLWGMRDVRFVAHARTDMPRLIAALKAVLEEHAPESLDLLHPDCAEGACDHDPDDPERPSGCPVVKTTVCAGCLDLAERAWHFYGEEGVEAVEYPCPTLKALAEALGVSDE